MLIFTSIHRKDKLIIIQKFFLKVSIDDKNTQEITVTDTASP